MDSVWLILGVATKRHIASTQSKPETFGFNKKLPRFFRLMPIS